MHLFKTEMLFLEPPRTRFAYGRRAPRLQRYGRHALPHLDAAHPDAAPADASVHTQIIAVITAMEATAAMPTHVVERAA